MNGLWEMSMPWWHFAGRGAVAYLVLLLLLRMTGKRAFGEMSPFDIVVLILVGGTLRSAIVGNDTSLLGPLIAVATILLIDKLLGAVAAVSPRFNTLLEGSPLLLVVAGRLVRGALKRASIPRAGFDRELRLHEIHALEDVEEARLEPNGRISVLKRK